MLQAIGALVQLVGVVLLAVLLLLLRRYADVRGYFGPWTLGWASYAVGLAAVVTRHVVAPKLGTPLGSAAAAATDAVYVVGKSVFLVGLCAGAARFAGRRGRVGPIAAGAVVYCAIALLLSGDLNRIIAWQAPLAAAASFTAGALLLTAPRRRASVGSVVTGTSCVALGMLWVLYGIAFSEPGRGLEIPFFDFLTTYHSFVDLLVAVTLGFGMIVLVLEDAKHAADRAHEQLVATHESLRRIAVQDALTGALNRSAFLETAALGAALPAGAVVLVDLDDLKVVNDTHGHATGDRLLAHFAMTLRRGLPDQARLYRWGGDEFVVVAPGAQPGRTWLAISSILATAEPLRVGGEELSVAASLGEAPYADGADLENAVARADASMYVDKVRRKGTPVRSIAVIAAAG